MNNSNRQGRQRALTPTQVADIAARVARGETKKFLADHYKVSIQTIYRSLSRDESPQPMKIELKPCGTNAAYARHIRKGELACDACLRGHSERRAEDVAKDPNYKEKRKKWNQNRKNSASTAVTL